MRNHGDEMLLKTVRSVVERFFNHRQGVTCSDVGIHWYVRFWIQDFGHQYHTDLVDLLLAFFFYQENCHFQLW